MPIRRHVISCALLSALVCGSCARPRASLAPYAERQEVEHDLEMFRRAWLQPAKVAPPTISFDRRTVTAGPLSVEILPVRAEEQDWNTWPEDGLRLFNNRSAYLFEVRVSGAERLRWVPEATRLELNVAGEGVAAAATPEDLLMPLLQAAVAQERFGIDGDLVQRTRGAGPFRAAYLPTAPQLSELVGLIAFPADDAGQHVVVLRVSVAVHDGTQTHVAQWTFD